MGQQGIDAGADAETAALMAWSQGQGLAALFLRERLMIFSEDLHLTTMAKVMRLFIKVMGLFNKVLRYGL